MLVSLPLIFKQLLSHLLLPVCVKPSVLVDGYDQAVSSTLYQHAPLKTKKVVYECFQPWYCSMIGDAIRTQEFGENLES